MPARSLVCPICLEQFVTYKARDKTCSPKCMGEHRKRVALEKRASISPPSEPPPNAQWLPLTRGEFALVDLCVFESVSVYTWRFVGRDTRNGDGYVTTLSSRKVIYLHKFVIGVDNGQVDHKNGNRFDCRIANLRPATPSQNSMNRRKRSDWKWSKYKGVGFRGGAWMARIVIDDRRVQLGTFASEVDAACAYDEAARKHFGEFAVLNFPAP